MIPRTQAALTIEKITSELGYAEIRIDEVEIVNKFDIILHIINPNEIINLIDNLGKQIETLREERKDYLRKELYSLRSKVLTLLPHRSKRGMINIVGKGLSWLFGTLDEDDKHDIENKLKSYDNTNDELIDTINQQVKINSNFNDSFTLLKNVIESDRNKILEKLNMSQNLSKQIISQEEFLEQQMRISILKEKINLIQDNIILARIGVIHPSILSNEEIIKYKIDIQKLSNMKVGIAKFENQDIIFAIKIPTAIMKTARKLLVPIVNSNNKQINEELEYVVKINNNTYSFENNLSLQELKLSKNCIVKKNCKLLSKLEEEIIELNFDLVILNNMKNKTFKSNCDERILVLNGNYFINFVNCSVEIGNQKFSNRMSKFVERFYIPNHEIIATENDNLIFENFTLHQERNIKEIHILKKHNIISYSIGSFSIVLIVLVAVIGIYIYCKQKKLNLTIVNRIQENSEVRKGGVTSQSIGNMMPTGNVRPEIIEFIKNMNSLSSTNKIRINE